MFSFSIELDGAAIKKHIWKTQLKMLFPIIEDYRGAIVEKYRTRLRANCQSIVLMESSLLNPRMWKLEH